MRNKILGIILMSALGLQLVACGSAEVANAEGVELETVAEAVVESADDAKESEAVAEAPVEAKEESAQTAQETAAQIERYDFEGQYYAGKGNLSITQEAEGKFLIEVWWAIDAASHGEWVMNGTYDEGSQTITYSDCVKHEFTLKDNGEVDTDVTVYSDGTGSIKIVDASTILWNDDMEHVADDVPMTR